MPQELISSRATFFCKFVFPPIFTLCLGLGMFPIAEDSGGYNPAHSALIWTASGAWLVASACVWRNYSQLKKVWIEDSNFVLSNYRREAAIPFAAVRQVLDSRLSNPAMIKVVLDESSRPCKSFAFLSPLTLSLPGEEDPMAVRLRQLIRERTGRAVD